MFEITPDDVALLNDEDLRSLVGRLCESEMRRRGISPSCVTWGGNQRAADGGLDVRVALPPNVDGEGFIPRPDTGFQVKAEDMQAAKIRSEMRPKEELRSSIRDLAEKSGAYIIVSSKGSTSDLPLQNRREAMREAISDIPNRDALTVDFYDRTRIATWVRDHAGLIPWVREKIGRPFQGWHSYSAWAYSPEGVEDHYLLDDKIRVRAGSQTPEGGLKPLYGLKQARDRLCNAGKVVRLVGLSGVGKTRFVQALFDGRVGEGSLDPSLAWYTNMTDEPDPTPAAVAADLITARQRAILIIDNCSGELHQRLSEMCRCAESLISLITVEYDIREDQPEGTEVFSLESASADLIERLVGRRFPHVSPVDVRNVAEFSGGNARIAIALAGTIGKNDTIAGLTDENLFTRLFEQRWGQSESLLLAAQALSLVYSFQGEDVSGGDEAELFRLGALIGRTPQEMFRSVAELQSRDLVQRRGVWRAVLPQAIAIRLAKNALQKIPFSEIETRLVNGAPKRLVKSFSRRLGYLDSNEAKSIVIQWLGAGGRLEHISDLDDLGRVMFNNVAPVAPEVTLVALERVLHRAQGAEVVQRCGRYVQLLRSLAYDAVLFERCAALLVRIAEVGEGKEDASEAAKVLASLFLIQLSGTHATLEQRLDVIRSLLESDDPKRCSLGSLALRAALEAWHFGAAYNFEFGARSRDFGYFPRNRAEVKEWFGSMLQLAERLASSNKRSAPQVRAVIAKQFRALWTGALMYEELEGVCRGISKKQFWREGWIAVRETIRFDSKGMPPEVSARLTSLAELLRPKELLQEVRSIALSDHLFDDGLDAQDDSALGIQRMMDRLESMAQTLGRTVAADKCAFAELLPELVIAEGRVWSLGRGLAQGAKHPEELWSRLVLQLAATPQDKRTFNIFGGFLSALRNTRPELTESLLDGALENDTLAPCYPWLQTAAGIDEKGVIRLIRSLELGKSPIRTYRCLMFGRAMDPVPGEKVRSLLRKTAEKPGGWDVAMEVLYMRIHSLASQKESCDPETIAAGRELMCQLRFAMNAGLDHRLDVISKHCLVGDKSAAIVEEIC